MVNFLFTAQLLYYINQLTNNIMQTFMTYPSFYDSLKSLDNKRLGKQRVEAKQILNVLLNRPRKDGEPYKGWLNHPCVRMWRGYENALKEYFNISLMVWEERGFKNNMEVEEHNGCVPLPDWINNPVFYLSHRANLLRKDYEFYSKYGWQDEVSPNEPYAWLDENGNWYLQYSGSDSITYLDSTYV